MIGSLDTRDRSFLFSRRVERPLDSADIDLVVFDGDPLRGQAKVRLVVGGQVAEDLR